ncbi:MAG: lamin tail domain-containing protein [Candidatus Krumholzibacteriota bacterium]|nr:lamin tail domain-containing protein [Candidatus Krumholzibacteriota bacterium]
MMKLKGHTRKKIFPSYNNLNLNISCGMFLLFGLFAPGVFPAPSICAEGIVINEIYYDHPGSDTGHEFVELYNTGEEAVNLNGFRIEFLDGRTGGSETYFSFIDNIYLASQELIFAGGQYCVPTPEFTAMCGLQNGPDAVRLIYNGSIVDLAGYGELSLSALYESKPAVDVDAGFSLSRKPDGRDSENNNADFVPSSPTPGEKNFFRTDLELSIKNDELFPCANAPVSLDIELKNCGLENFSCPVHICVAAVSKDIREKIAVISNKEALKSEEVFGYKHDFSVSGFSDSVSVLAFIEEDEDQNTGNDSACVSFYISPRDLVINEIMYRPDDGSSEWIELYNTGDNCVNLRGWFLSDANRAGKLISSSELLIAPGRYLLLAQFPEGLKETLSDGNIAIHDVEGGWPVLNDYSTPSSPEVIIMKNRRDRIEEKIEYHNITEEERGRSIERFSPFVCSLVKGGLWHRSAAPCGSTPGKENSSFNGLSAITEKLRISPNPFSLSRDGELVISGKARSRDSGFLVRIFNMEGMEVIRLAGEKNGADYFSLLWDGLDSEGRAVVTGLYICVVEYFGLGGSVCRIEKKCVAVKNDR